MNKVYGALLMWAIVSILLGMVLRLTMSKEDNSPAWEHFLCAAIVTGLLEMCVFGFVFACKLLSS